MRIVLVSLSAIFSSGLSAFGSDPGKSDSVRLQNLCTMLFSMFVSLPTGQVFWKRTISSFFRIGPTLVVATFARCEALFSFSSANFYIIASISISVNSFFHFFIFLSADLWSDVAAVFAAKFIIEISSTSVNRKFIFFSDFFLTVKTYVTIREILCYHLIRTFELQTYLSCPVVSILMLLHLFPKFFLTGKYFSPI